MLKRLVLLILSLTLLSSCGFKLRGNFEMSSALSQISVAGEDRLLNEALTKQLEKSGATVAQSKAGIPRLSVIFSEYDRIVRTTDSDGLATGYDYTFTVKYLVTDGKGGLLQPESKITQRRTLFYDPTEQLSVVREEEFLKEEMQEEIVLQIMRKISRI